MKPEQDLIDRLIADWKRQDPGLSADSMGIVGRILRLSRILDARVTEALKPLGLHYTDFDVLATLRRVGAPHELNPTELLRSVLITSGAMTAALGRLEAGGLVKRGTSASDGRVKTVVLTKKGMRLVDRAAKVRFEQADRSIEGLGRADREGLASLLRTLLVELDTPER